MPSSAKGFSAHDLTQLGILLAAAIALRFAESTVAYLLPLPGAHLGLANAVTIIVLYLYGTKRTALFLAARILLTGLLFTGLFSPGFSIGLAGAVLSFLFMALAVQKDWFPASALASSVPSPITAVKSLRPWCSCRAQPL